MLAAAISVDVVKAGYKIKGDEATYVAMALSVAYDRDLSFQRRDLERFYGIYQQGPEGIFLKRGKQFRVRLRASPPFLFIYNNTAEGRQDRAFFGKAMVYSLAAAPFVWLLGMSGFLVFHVLMLFLVGACGYLFLAARSRPGPALAFTLGVHRRVSGARLRRVSDVRSLQLHAGLRGVLSVALQGGGAATRPLAQRATLRPAGGHPARHRDLFEAVARAAGRAAGALVLVARAMETRVSIVGAVSVAAAALLFLATAVSSGEFNYQGGDRKTFYSVPDDPRAPRDPQAGFVFASPADTWDVRGFSSGRNEANVDNVLQPSEMLRLFPTSVKYFLIGRHFGFVPYFFPGVVAIVMWLLSRERSEAVAGVGVPRRGRGDAGGPRSGAVHVERRRRPAGEPLFPQLLSGPVFHHAAAQFGDSARCSHGLAGRCSRRRW